MQEFSSVSASSTDPAALAAILTDKSADGWNVVSIVGTATGITAFLSREASASSATSASTSTSAFTPLTPESPVSEPAGWAVAPESASPTTSAAATGMAPISAATQQPVAAATPAVPAGWYADPAGRFDLRYWDGNTWTEHVSRAGQQYTDPPTA